MRTLKELYEIILRRLEGKPDATFICNQMLYAERDEKITSEEHIILSRDFLANKPLVNSEWTKAESWRGGKGWWYLSPAGREQRILFLTHLIKKHS